ncbi:hypothetical protein EVAR_71533_1 [Eumeta japonica]|uniref:Uncharacterized protein n=1 Tax=Eumeta variegata TaxID=151549 RepID=A0A4C1TIF7_EUMVA|nr:hypothetical protein EVAR_71533_1 [Eumeta japonica]
MRVRVYVRLLYGCTYACISVYEVCAGVYVSAPVYTKCVQICVYEICVGVRAPTECARVSIRLRLSVQRVCRCVYTACLQACVRVRPLVPYLGEHVPPSAPALPSTVNSPEPHQAGAGDGGRAVGRSRPGEASEGKGPPPPKDRRDPRGVISASLAFWKRIRQVIEKGSRRWRGKSETNVTTVVQPASASVAIDMSEITFKINGKQHVSEYLCVTAAGGRL